MSDIEKSKIVIPAPIMHPMTAMVQGKNFLPANATINPKTMARGPSI